MIPRAPAVRAFSLSRVAPGSAHALSSAELASQQKSSVAGSTARTFSPTLDASDALDDFSAISPRSRDHGAVNTRPPFSGGGQSTKRRSRPGLCLVTTADTTASAGPGAPISSGGSSVPAVHALESGPKTMDGTHLASSRSARHATASRATVSASTFAITTPSALRAALWFSTGSNEFAIAFRDFGTALQMANLGLAGFARSRVRRDDESGFSSTPTSFARLLIRYARLTCPRPWTASTTRTKSSSRWRRPPWRWWTAYTRRWT
mmetsp:Transcript_5782/g.23395  ORF Transcript_5782/g.23395 Transcript_5782/m.23395 type:complete len:264 (+) Transcript_5782:2291-3082(+)